MSLYTLWKSKAYNKDGGGNADFWNDYMPKEQKIYEYLLGEKINSMEKTIQSLADQFQLSEMVIIGFLDGIQDVLKETPDFENLTSESLVSIAFEFKDLYQKMVEYKAEHLYSLPQWDGIFDKDKQKELYLEEKKSKTIIKDKKIGRNDPCPCNSGKKFKKCCGAS